MCEKLAPYEFYVVDSSTGWTAESLSEIRTNTNTRDLDGMKSINKTRVKPSSQITSVDHGVRANRRKFHTQLGTDANNIIAKSLQLRSVDSERENKDVKDKLDMKALSEELDNLSDISYEEEPKVISKEHIQPTPQDYTNSCVVTDTEFSQSLLSLATQGDTVRIAKLLTSSTDVDTTDATGTTPLMHAIHGSHRDCICLLLEAGADTNIQLSDGTTVLHKVAFSGNHIILSLLLQHKVTKTEIKDSNGRTPLHWATHAPTASCINQLLYHDNSVIDLCDLQGMTAVMWTAYLAQPDHLKQLIHYGASLATQDNDGMSAIHWCVNGSGDNAERITCFRELLSIDSSRYFDSNGKTVTHYIAETSTTELLSLVVSVRASAVQDMDRKRRTPLHWAAACGNESVLSALLQSGASLTTRDEDGMTALDYAMAKDFKECVELLRENERTCMSSLSSISRLVDQTMDLSVTGSDKHSFTLSDLILLRYIGTGCYLYKYTNKGKGPIHRRYFWVNLESGHLCWSKVHNPANSEIRTSTIKDIRPSASLAILGRKDFDSSLKHQFCFCVLCSHSIINIVAVDNESYTAWVRGVKMYLSLGAKVASQLVIANKDVMCSIEEAIDRSY